MADKMTRNVFCVVMVSVWHAMMTLVMLPTFMVQWLTGTHATKPPQRKNMSSNGQSKNGCECSFLTDSETEMVKKSWDMLAEDKAGNGVVFFIKLFEIHPVAKDYFRQFKDIPLEKLREQGTGNKKLVAHAKSVMYALESYIDTLDDAEVLTELVKKVAYTHKKRNIGPAQFKLLTDVFEVLVEELAKGDESLDVAIAKSGWKKLMDVVCDIVKKEQED